MNIDSTSNYLYGYKFSIILNYLAPLLSSVTGIIFAIYSLLLFICADNAQIVVTIVVKYMLSLGYPTPTKVSFYSPKEL